jgi:hypothetical protein
MVVFTNHSDSVFMCCSPKRITFRLEGLHNLTRQPIHRGSVSLADGLAIVVYSHEGPAPPLVRLAAGGPLDSANINHVAIVIIYSKFNELTVIMGNHVDDFNVTAAAYAKLFGVEVEGSLSTDHWVWYRGNYTQSRPTLAFINMGASDSFRLEVIYAPSDEPSFWNELRKANGPMFHHTGVNVPDMDAAQAALEALGCPLRQMGQGDW